MVIVHCKLYPPSISSGTGIVDATLTYTPNCPKDKPEYEIA